MKAINAFGPKDLRLVDVPDPSPKAGEVLISVKACGICGSDKWLWNVQEKVEKVYGHEAAGEVVGLGEGVTSLQVGERVAVNNAYGCGHCATCRSGAFIFCPNRDQSGYINGGFGELMTAPDRNCLRLADEMDYLSGCMIFDLFGTPFSATERAQIGIGDDVIVSGLGPIGLAAVMLARHRGAYVIGIDPLPYRREMALHLGASQAFAPGPDMPDAVRSCTSGLGVRVVLECSGKSSAYVPLMNSMRAEGLLLTIGQDGHFDLIPDDVLIPKALSIGGSNYSTMPQGQAVHDLFLSKKIDPKVLVSHTGTLAETPHLFSLACDFGDEVLKTVILH